MPVPAKRGCLRAIAFWHAPRPRFRFKAARKALAL